MVICNLQFSHINTMRKHHTTKQPQSPKPINWHKIPKSQGRILHLPRVYSSHSFEKTPPFCCCSFQLARRVSISGLFDSRFCDCRFENNPVPDPALERRRSATDGRVGAAFAAPLLALALALAAPLPAEPVEASEPYTRRNIMSICIFEEFNVWL